MSRISLTGLVKIELPSATLRLSDGGFIVHDGETYRSKDPVFGTIGTLQTMQEGVGDFVPALVMTLLPPSTSAAEDISQPGNQTARVHFIIAEYDVDTNIISMSDTFFNGQIDQTILTESKERKELTVSVVSLAERMFERNIGNTLNSTWHKSIWSGEKGHDNATGLGSQVAWGVEAPRNGGSSGGSRLGPGGGSDVLPRDFRQY